MSIVGGIIGLPVGAITGSFCQFLIKDVYPDTWVSAYSGIAGSALPIQNGFFGIIGGTVFGVMGGKLSKRMIKDYGLIGGITGGVLGGIVGGTYGVYLNYSSRKQIQ
jgi:hypothetical protein